MTKIQNFKRNLFGIYAPAAALLPWSSPRSGVLQASLSSPVSEDSPFTFQTASLFYLGFDQLRVHLKITSHFIRRCISFGSVAKPRNIQVFLRLRALSQVRLNA